MTLTTIDRAPAPLPNIPPGKRFHKTVSPSQVDTYKKCPRRWYNASVLYDREPSKGFQLKGDAIHKALEVYGQTGEVLTSVKMHNPATGQDEQISTFAFVQAAIPHIKPPANDPYWDEWKGKGPGGTNAAGLMLEQQADMPTWADYDRSGAPLIGPNWTQFIDRVEAFPTTAKIIDYKTTSDFRYAKKPAELKEHNTQLLANARWLFQNSDYQEVEIGHLYLGTKTKTPKALPVFVTVTREDVEKFWREETVEIVKEMVTWAAMNPPTADPLPPNTSSCGDYGGCYYREKCGFDSKGAPLTKIRPFGEKPPEVSQPVFPITISPTTVRSPMETATPSAPAVKGGLLATLMAGAKKPAAAPAALPSGPSASPAPVVGLVAPKASPFGPKPAPTPAPVVGLVVPATGTGPAPAPKGGGLAALFGAKKAPAAAAPVATPTAALEAAPGSISPPDAAPDTSTPEEVAAANPEPVKSATAVENAPASEGAPAEAPKKRGRPAGSKNKTETVTVGAPPAGEPAIVVPQDVAPSTESASTTESAPAEAVEAPDAAPEAAPVNGAVEAIRFKLRTGDAAFACPVRFLFVDCLPGKGWPAEHAPEDLENFMHAFEATAAASANAADYRLIRYESKGYLSMAIRLLMGGLPVAVHVHTNTPGAAEFLAEVTPYAEMVFRGTR